MSRSREITAADRACASAFLTRVAARGARVWLVGSCLKISGEHYRHALTDTDRDLVRTHRRAIVAALFDRRALPPAATEHIAVGNTNTNEKTSTSEPTPHAAPPSTIRCVHPATLRILNYNTPEERERRRVEATAVMLHQIGRRHPWNR